MKVFYDSNVVLDVLLSRTEFLQTSMAALKLSEIGKVKGYVSAASMTDIHYIIHRNIKNAELEINKLKVLLQIVSIATVKEKNILQAINSGWKDFEDSVQASVAKSIRAKCIVTRNKKDYINSTIPVYTPSEFLEFMSKN